VLGYSPTPIQSQELSSTRLGIPSYKSTPNCFMLPNNTHLITRAINKVGCGAQCQPSQPQERTPNRTRVVNNTQSHYSIRPTLGNSNCLVWFRITAPTRPVTIVNTKEGAQQHTGCKRFFFFFSKTLMLIFPKLTMRFPAVWHGVFQHCDSDCQLPKTLMLIVRKLTMPFQYQVHIDLCWSWRDSHGAEARSCLIQNLCAWIYA
jgi:hypothetical protein